MHFLVTVLLNNHTIERNMIHDIINALNDIISILLHFISFNFIQVHYYHYIQLNVQVFEVSLQEC